MDTTHRAVLRRLTAALTTSLALVGGSANASAYQGQVVSVYAINNSMLITLGSGAFDGPAAGCANAGSSVSYYFDPNTPYGRTLLTLALSAKLTGRLVYASAAASTCGSAGFEQLQHLDLKG